MCVVNELISENLFFLLYNELSSGNFSTVKFSRLELTEQ